MQAGNIDLNGVAITLNGGVTTSAGGSVTITNSGLLTIADTGGAADTVVDLNLDGAFLQDGTGGVDIAGDITTTADSITFQRAVTLSGDVAIDSANGAVTFSTTVDDDAAGGAGDYFLAVDSGGGALTFNNDVGSARSLNHLRLLGCGNLVVNVATNLSFQDIYIDAPGANIVLQQDITLGGRLIFYRGNLNLNGNVLSSEAISQYLERPITRMMLIGVLPQMSLPFHRLNLHIFQILWFTIRETEPIQMQQVHSVLELMLLLQMAQHSI